MKYIIMFCILSTSIPSLYGGYLGGQLVQLRNDQQEAVSQNVAHYDLRTREFAWGDPRDYQSANVQLSTILKDSNDPEITSVGNIPIPAHKPHVK